jgi:hypothetical protein
MKWIDVNEDLPPKGTMCLVIEDFRGGLSNYRKFEVSEAKFCPRSGWVRSGHKIDVICWCCPKGLLDYDDLVTRLTSEESQAACETQDESQ